MNRTITRFLIADDGAMTANFVVLAAAIVGIGLTSVTAVTLGASTLAEKFESGVVQAGTVTLCFFSSDPNCGADATVENEDNVVLTDGGGAGGDLVYDFQTLTQSEADRLANELRLNAADRVLDFVSNTSNDLYAAINDRDFDKAALMLDYFNLGLQVLQERYGYEGDAEKILQDFRQAADFYAASLDRQQQTIDSLR
jgi:hypothetical protein